MWKPAGTYFFFLLAISLVSLPHASGGDVTAGIREANRFLSHLNAPPKMTTIIKITLKNGRTISGRADFGKGSPSDPMSYDEVAEKFRGCAAFAEWPSSKANQVIDMVRSLEDLSESRI